jgi:hypothetical protein
LIDFCFEIVQLLNSITEFPTIQRKRRGVQLRNQPGPVLCLCVLSGDDDALRFSLEIGN